MLCSSQAATKRRSVIRLRRGMSAARIEFL
jgi:hypothetical protein